MKETQTYTTSEAAEREDRKCLQKISQLFNQVQSRYSFQAYVAFLSLVVFRSLSPALLISSVGFFCFSNFHASAITS